MLGKLGKIGEPETQVYTSINEENDKGQEADA
jgi:hypothetical protein